MNSVFFGHLLVSAPLGGARPADLWEMVVGAGPVVKFVLLLLLFFSVVSWSIIIFKYFQVRRARRQSYRFLELFWRAKSLASAYGESRELTASPVAEIFRVGYMELGRVRKTAREAEQSGEETLAQHQGVENVERALRRAMSVEATRLQRSLPFLATTGNTTPFIGLFGTVWGIMASFRSIGVMGAANLAVVAPGISEALVATAAGLAAAIPAVMAYNHFNSRVRVLEAEMRNFSADFLNIIEREAYRKAGPRPGGG